MKRIAALGLCLLAVSAHLKGQPTQVRIHNQQLRLTIYTPDPQNGFYRATRFEWGGAICDLEFAGHHLYRPWYNSVDPSVLDVKFEGRQIVVGPNAAMCGPAEEFQTPIGYDTAKPGETFLKIGVGILRKPNNNRYFFGTHFEIVDGGRWTVRHTSRSVTSRQVLGGPKSKYGYIYTKTIRLVGDKSQLIIEHTLKNTGKAPLETALYDHNFFTVDGLNVGPADSVKVLYAIKPARLPNPAFAKVEENRAFYVAPVTGENRVAWGLQGFSNEPRDYDFTVTNTAAPVQVHFEGNRPLIDAAVWSIRSVFAVEPFIQIKADPGQTFTWSYTYTYSIPGK